MSSELFIALLMESPTCSIEFITSHYFGFNTMSFNDAGWKSEPLPSLTTFQLNLYLKGINLGVSIIPRNEMWLV